MTRPARAEQRYQVYGAAKDAWEIRDTWTITNERETRPWVRFRYAGVARRKGKAHGSSFLFSSLEAAENQAREMNRENRDKLEDGNHPTVEALYREVLADEEAYERRAEEEDRQRRANDPIYLRNLVKQLTDALSEVCKDEVCDHSVGICWCHEYSLIEKAREVLR